MQRWVSQGRIFGAEHAQVPVAFIKPHCLRIYYSTRDSKNRSITKFIDVDKSDPTKILYQSDSLLPLGEPGSFDQAGIMPSWVYEEDGFIFLFYIGWTQRLDIPYFNSVGLAVSDDEGDTFKKLGSGPLFGPTFHESGFTGSSCIIPMNGGYINYYLYCCGWREVNGRMEPRYRINRSFSEDLINWGRHNIPAIDFSSDEEGGIVKASVLPDKGCYKMWYSYRKLRDYRTDTNAAYRIGYAESSNGMAWERKDDQIVFEPEGGWDDFMQCYPHVIDLNGERIMFYNGNGFGQAGFGYARLT